VLTISDTRTTATDVSGRLICERLEAAGHEVCDYRILPDEPGLVRGAVVELSDDAGTHAICLTGGTGLSPRDSTYEAVAAVFEKRLDGFGELFRVLSFEQVGAAAMLSRATAGIRNATAIFSMPGSVKAVELAMDKLIIPELTHIASLLGHRTD